MTGNEQVKETTAEQINLMIDDFIDSFNRKIILREEVEIVKPKVFANCDCKRMGPEGKFMIGGKVAYPAESLRVWLKKQCSPKWRGTKLS